MTIPMMLLLSALEAPSQPAAEAYTPEQLAVGAIREIITAQHVHEQKYPELGYACSLERLVETQMLLDTWLQGGRVEGYSFRLWCEKSSAPQASFRASAVPVKKAKGATWTVCTDETNVPRTVEGDVETCFTRGDTGPK